MLETVGDIWEHADRGEIIVITTNGSLTRDGRAIFGRGVARQAALRFPELADELGKLLAELGSHAGWQRIIVPRPGCGGGGLSWKEVKPLLESCFDHRFLVIDKVLT